MSSQVDGSGLKIPDRRGGLLELRGCAPYRRNLHTGQFEYVSPVVEELTGFSAEETYAMPPEEWLARIHPEDRRKLRRKIERPAARGRAVIEYRFRHKDGEFRWIAQRVDVEPEFGGPPLHCIGFLRRRELTACFA